jgi:AcrR family transcriptional regulator
MSNSSTSPSQECPVMRRPVHRGRPPRELAGEVETRILDAARRVFLDRGLAGASVDEIAARAGAGKPTIYGRFPGKEALFAAVVMRNVDVTAGQLKIQDAVGATIEERLAALATTLLHWALLGDTIGLMRLAIAEARRFPYLASSVSRMARGRATDRVVQVLAEVAQSLEPPVGAFLPERLPATTGVFIDLILLPPIMRALFGEKVEILHAEIGPHVARSVAFFLAGCRGGGVD